MGQLSANIKTSYDLLAALKKKSKQKKSGGGGGGGGGQLAIKKRSLSVKLKLNKFLERRQENGPIASEEEDRTKGQRV